MTEHKTDITKIDKYKKKKKKKLNSQVRINKMVNGLD